MKGFAQKSGCRIINPRNYNDWGDAVNEICESRLVVSESLHGLITAETYGIPSVWGEFMEHGDYLDFKFQTFMSQLENFTWKV